MIQFENVTTESFDYASFEVRSGCRCKIIANSRHEKQVLLDTIVGLRKPLAGRVFLLGKSIYSIPEQELFKVLSRVGMVWQDGRLLSSLTVWENVILPSYYQQGKRPDDLEDKVIALCRALKIGGENLSGFMGKMPGHLTPHEKRMAGLVRAMLTEPELIIYDAPFKDLPSEETEGLGRLTQDFHLRKVGRISVYISVDEKSMQHVESDMTLKQINRKWAIWES